MYKVYEMKKIIKLTERDLTRIVRRVLMEQGEVPTQNKLNPRWLKVVNTLRKVGRPKILTFKDYDGNLSQSLGWGSAKSFRGRYAFAITKDYFENNKPVALFSDDDELEAQIYQWWIDKGYKTNVVTTSDPYGHGLYLPFDNIDKVKSDLIEFFKAFPPDFSGGKLNITKWDTNSTLRTFDLMVNGYPKYTIDIVNPKYSNNVVTFKWRYKNHFTDNHGSYDCKTKEVSTVEGSEIKKGEFASSIRGFKFSPDGEKYFDQFCRVPS